MNKKDILELKRRFKKDACTFTRLCGCYVDADRNKVTTFGETFLNLEDEEFYKYLEIAKKVMSGTIGNNILELEFPTAEEAPGGRQQFLMGLRESALKNDDLMDTFYDLVIENYSYVGNYLILVFHDAYGYFVSHYGLSVAGAVQLAMPPPRAPRRWPGCAPRWRLAAWSACSPRSHMIPNRRNCWSRAPQSGWARRWTRRGRCLSRALRH